MNEVAAYWNVDQLIFLVCLFSVMVKHKCAMKCRTVKSSLEIQVSILLKFSQPYLFMKYAYIQRL